VWKILIQDSPSHRHIEHECGEDLKEGFFALWEHTLRQGIDDAGLARSLWFWLEWSHRGERVATALPRDATENSELAKLRGWKDSRAIGAAAAAHFAEERDYDRAATIVLRCIQSSANVKDFLAAMPAPIETPRLRNMAAGVAVAVAPTLHLPKVMIDPNPKEAVCLLNHASKRTVDGTRSRTEVAAGEHDGVALIVLTPANVTSEVITLSLDHKGELSLRRADAIMENVAIPQEASRRIFRHLEWSLQSNLGSSVGMGRGSITATLGRQSLKVLLNLDLDASSYQWGPIPQVARSVVTLAEIMQLTPAQRRNYRDGLDDFPERKGLIVCCALGSPYKSKATSFVYADGLIEDWEVPELNGPGKRLSKQRVSKQKVQALAEATWKLLVGIRVSTMPKREGNAPTDVLTLESFVPGRMGSCELLWGSESRNDSPGHPLPEDVPTVLFDNVLQAMEQLGIGWR
jgi:hypothetical protein